MIEPNFEAVTNLKITDCPLDLVKNSYKKYKNLESLDLSNSGFDSLDSFQLNHGNLIKLNMSHNNLTRISQNFFENTPEMTEIDFSRNQLKVVHQYYFKNATKLEKIHLSHNRIEVIDYRSFGMLKKLRFVDLSYNGERSLSNYFSNNTNLEIHFENNIFSYICTNTLLEKNHTLYLSWESIQEFSAVNDYRELDVVLNSENEAISTRTPGKIELHFPNKQVLRNLESFRAGKSRVNNLMGLLTTLNPSILTTLDLSNNSIGKLELNTLENFTNLLYLFVRNSNITKFDFNFLKNMRKLVWFDMSDNNLKNVQNINVLKNLTKIIGFGIMNNRLPNTLEIIDNLSELRLRNLHVSGNFIGQLKPETFARFNKLTILHLSDTSLSTFDFNPFEPLKELDLLDLSYNNLRNQNFDIISSSLKKLYTLAMRA